MAHDGPPRLPSPTTTATDFAASVGAESGAKLQPTPATQPNTGVAQPGPACPKAAEPSRSQGTGMLQGAAKAGSPQGGEVGETFATELSAIGSAGKMPSSSLGDPKAPRSATRGVSLPGAPLTAREVTRQGPPLEIRSGAAPAPNSIVPTVIARVPCVTTALLERARSVPVFHAANLSSATFLTEREAAAWAGLSAATLQNWRVKGYGPPWLKLSARAICYRTSDVEAWLASRERRSTSDTGNNNA